MALCVKVVIDDIVNKIDKLYDYYVPQELDVDVQVGIRVVVPFSRSNMRKNAFVIEMYSSEEISGLKPVISIVDQKPLINECQIKILKLLKNRYFITYYRALKSIVPRGIDVVSKEKFLLDDSVCVTHPEFYSFFKKTKGEFSVSELDSEQLKIFNSLTDDGRISKEIVTKQKISDKTEKKLVVNLLHGEIEDVISKLEKRFSKQQDLLSVFLDYKELSLKDALYYSGCSESTVNTLVKKGIIEIVNEKVSRNPYKDIEKRFDITQINLSSEQTVVYENICKQLDEYKTHLVHGVTGSGKTLLYISILDKIIKQGKSAIFMVPEISLTPQMLERFYTRYGEMVAVIHSGLTPGERTDEWKKIKDSKQSVVVGTRSAVFSPINNLGIIIIDEEHESSYKSESTPKYHARDISKYICKINNIPLILGSATPSIESFYYAQKGIYNYNLLSKRFNNNPLPMAEIVDMKTSFTECEQSFLSDRLAEEIEINLKNKEQTILFLNRRGANTLVGCRSCGYVEKCPNCGIALTYHSANGRCMCHYCGYNIKMFEKCPSCSSEHIKRLGVGTQLVCSELSEKFPDAKILRMDFDTVGSYVEYGTKLSSFKNGDYDIMLGTQMVAKGLDFPNVTLVGVLNADLSLYVEDFRANERTFSLLTQVCGRSGRAGKEGRALIQTYSSDSEIIRYAKEQDYNRYFDFEITFRKAMNYPPFCDLVQFTVSSFSESKAYKDVMELYKYIDNECKNTYSDIPVRLLHPVAPKIAKFNKKYRYNLTIKTKISNRLYEFLNDIYEHFDVKDFSDVSLNINPMNNI